MSLNLLSIIIITSITKFIYVNGHGRLIEPPARSTAWRYGFHTPVNYNDNELFCGGFNVQWNMNKGKCGVCGDPYNGPRLHESGGKFAKNLVITRVYREAQNMEAKIELTANHRGFFTFRICPASNDEVEVTQDCLDKQVLTVLGSKHSKKYFVDTSRPGIFKVKLRLPQGFTCKRCVFQWTYTAGNNWGTCSDGKSAVGCGPQETFRGCADIKIAHKNKEVPGGSSSGFVPSTKKPTVPTKPTPRWKRPSFNPSTKYQIPSRASSWMTSTMPSTKKISSLYTPTRRSVVKTRRPQTSSSLYSTSLPPGFKSTKKINKDTSTHDRTSFKTSTTRQIIMRSTRSPIAKSPTCSSVWNSSSAMDSWCEANCSRGFCPKSHCICY